MKPWIRGTLYGLLGASIILGGVAAFGYRYYGHHGWHASAQDQARFRERMIERVSDRLDLTADQRQRLAALADKLQEQRAALKGEATDPRAEIQALVAGERFDRARAQALVAQKTAAINGKSPEVIAAAADFYDGLNAGQQAKVREFMQHRHQGWWRRG